MFRKKAIRKLCLKLYMIHILRLMISFTSSTRTLVALKRGDSHLWFRLKSAFTAQEVSLAVSSHNPCELCISVDSGKHVL